MLLRRHRLRLEHRFGRRQMCAKPAQHILQHVIAADTQFVESLMTQTLIIHVIRTNKIPFLQSRASWALTATTLSIMAFGMWLPYSPLASALGFTRLPGMYWPILMLTLLGYMGLTQIIKVALLRKEWI